MALIYMLSLIMIPLNFKYFLNALLIIFLERQAGNLDGSNCLFITCPIIIASTILERIKFLYRTSSVVCQDFDTLDILKCESVLENVSTSHEFPLFYEIE